MESLLVAIVAYPELAGYEDLFARDARRADAFSNLLLIHVGRSRVDEPVSICDRRPHRSYCLLRLTMKHAKSERGHRDSIVQLVHGALSCCHCQFLSTELSLKMAVAACGNRDRYGRWKT